MSVNENKKEELNNLIPNESDIVSGTNENNPHVKLLSILNNLEEVVKKYNLEERNLSYLYSKCVSLFQQYKFPLNKGTSNFQNEINQVKNFITELTDSDKIKISQELELILSKEESARLVICGENNNEGHFSLGKNTIEYLETIRIYLVDDTSKNFIVSINDTVSELLQRIIGKISSLKKDLNQGYDLWEVPHGLPNKERKLEQNDLPVHIKRSWRRPARFYFLTRSEEEVKFKVMDLRKRTVSTAPRSTLASSSNTVSVKVIYESDCFKSFFIFEGEKGKEFKKRVLQKLSNFIDIKPSHSLFLDENSEGELQDDANVHALFNGIQNGKLHLKERKDTATKVTDSKENLLRSSLDRRRMQAFSSPNNNKLSFIGLRLEEVPEEIKEYSITAISIDLSYNLINSLPDWIFTIENLKVLNLASNKLTSINDSIRSLKKLQILDLSQNNISMLSPALFEIENLKSLYLSNNNVSEIPIDFSKLTKLEELTLAGNKIVFNDQNNVLSNLKSLRMLDLSSNELNEIPSFVFSLSHLEELYLSTNKIACIDKTLYILTHLKTLDMAGNKITEIPSGINKLINLQDLLLDGNPFKNVMIEELEEMEQLRVIKLPNCDEEEILKQKLSSLQERRLTTHRSTTHASVMDMLLEQTIEINEDLKSSDSLNNEEKKMKKASSLPSNEFTSLKSKSVEKEKVSKNPKYPLKKFATETNIGKNYNIPIITSDPSSYFVEIGRDLGLSKEEIFSPINLKLEYNQDDYFTNFHGLPHFNYLAMDKNKCPTIISVLNMPEKVNGEENFRALIKNKDGDSVLWIPSSLVKTHKKGKLSIQTKLFSYIQEHYKDSFTNVRLVDDLEISDDILFYESRISSNAFKFGIIYGEKATTEEEMYNVKNGSEEFDKFLSFLGEKITLKGWTNYCAGLDVECDRTGKYSLYQRWGTMEIMFHVSTYLPYIEGDEQQIERKKHIGNDIVVIIFQDEDAEPFNPSIMKSFFNHVFIVIRPMKTESGTKYTVSVASKNGVQMHTPHLQRPSIFEGNAQFRKFLFTKMINAERASYLAPSFSKALGRAREQLLTEIYKKYTSNERKGKTKKIKA